MHATDLVDSVQWNVEFWDIPPTDRSISHISKLTPLLDAVIHVIDRNENIAETMYACSYKPYFRSRETFRPDVHGLSPETPILNFFNKSDERSGGHGNVPTLIDSEVMHVSAKSGANCVRSFNEAIRSGISYRNRPDMASIEEVRKLINVQ
jgi:hypothetical protein